MPRPSSYQAPPIIRRLSAKWTIVGAYVFHLSYIAANFDGTGALLVPGALAAGALTGPLWSAQSTYLTTLALGDSQPSNAEATIARFNGLFGGLMQTSQIWGNLLSSIVLSSHNKTYHLFTRPTGDSDDATRITGSNSTTSPERYKLHLDHSVAQWSAMRLVARKVVSLTISPCAPVAQ